MQKCRSDGCAKWAQVGEKFCKDHNADPTLHDAEVNSTKRPQQKKPLTYIERQKHDLGLRSGAKTVGTQQGSLGHFMAQSMGKTHTGKSRGLRKGEFHNAEAAQYHANKGANKVMAKSFAAMVMATKDQSGNIKLPSKIIAEAKEKKRLNKCLVSGCEKDKVKKNYCAEHSNEFRIGALEEQSIVHRESSASKHSDIGKYESKSPTTAVGHDSGAGDSTKSTMKESKDESVVDEDNSLSRTSSSVAGVEEVYSLSILQKKESLPGHINKLCLEDYLSDFDFYNTFNMDRETFASFPAWRKRKLKSDQNIF